MPQPEYTRETKVHGVDKRKERRPPEITVPRIRVRSALRRSPRAQQQLAVATAVAEEEVMRAHVVNVTELLARTVRDTPLEETIAIYMRVLDVPRRDRRIVTARALALLQEFVPAHVMRPATPRAGKGGLLSRFKLRNITASVRLPDRFLPPRAQSASLSISANNLLTVTDFSGLDPEVVDRGSSGTEDFRRVDYYNFPPLRSFVMKLNVSF